MHALEIDTWDIEMHGNIRTIIENSFKTFGFLWYTKDRRETGQPPV